MCVSQTGLVKAVSDGMALVSIDGAIRHVPLTILEAAGIEVSPGDFVLVHTGLAMAVLSAEEAANYTSFLSEGAAHEDP